jgi:uncharacterized membrane protein
MRAIHSISMAALLAAIANGCRPAAEPAPEVTTAGPPASGAQANAAVVDDEGASFAGIGAQETISLVGTEPFWGGKLANGELTYSTPENQAGETIAVRRFAGNNGLGFSGKLQGAPLDLTITPGACSDGMSDRSYPYTATLRLGAEQRSGCAWTERQRFTGPEQP